MSEITLRDEMSCARRELHMRRHVYPGLVERKKQTQAWVDYQLACQEAIVARLEALYEHEQHAGQAELFRGAH
jgi:hypothetical protein